MSDLPHLFDHSLLALRAGRRNASGDFLLHRVADELADRLATITRPFPAILDLATPGPAIARMLHSLRPQSRVDVWSAADPRQPEGRSLALGEERYDLIISGLALQHVNDLPGALIQIRRALRPDGLFLGCLAGGATLTELRQVLTQAESESLGGVSPRIFPFADVRDMGGLLQRAGFALPVTDSDTVTIRYPDMFALLRDLRAMGATNILTERSRRPTPRALMLRAAELYGERFADADGKIRATIDIIWLSGWAPHESQQKPLKPGSAKQRLADALKATEQSAGEQAKR